MNRALQYYTMIKSGWLPDNIKDAFYPFFLTLINNNGSADTIQELSKKFEEKYGSILCTLSQGHL